MINKMENSTSRCIVCYQELPLNARNGRTAGYSKLDLQLNIIFLLRTVMDVSSVQLKNYFPTHGDPDGWVKLCHSCTENVVKARLFFTQMQSTRRRFLDAKWMIIEEVKRSLGVTGKRTGASSAVNMTEDIRAQYAKRRGCIVHPSASNPFITGDILAAELALQQQVSLVKTEPEVITLEDTEPELVIIPDSPSPDSEVFEMKEEGDLITIPVESTLADAEVKQELPDPLDPDSFSDGPDDDPHSRFQSKEFECEVSTATVSGALQPTPLSRSNKRELASDHGSDEEEFPAPRKLPEPDLPQMTIPAGAGAGKPRFIAYISQSKVRLIAQPQPNVSLCSSAPRSKTTAKTKGRKVKKCEKLSRRFQLLPCPLCKKPDEIRIASMEHSFHHLQTCSKSFAGVLSCDYCKCWTTPESEVLSYLQHILKCSTHQNPWRTSIVPCSLCESLPCLTYLEFVKHLQRNHRPQYVCTQCDQRFQEPKTGANSVLRHWKNEHPLLLEKHPPTERCRIDSSQLPEIPWFCPMCSNTFSQESERDVHLSTMHSGSGTKSKTTFDRKWSCKQCPSPTSYFSEFELKLHRILTHNNRRKTPKVIECDQCKEQFPDTVKLRNHRRTQHRLDPFRCAVDGCGAFFWAKDSVHRHMSRKHSSEPPKRAQCHHCGKSLVSEKAVEQHIKIFHEGKVTSSVICHLCGKICNVSTTLRNHLKIKHKIGKVYKCHRPDCESSFGTRSLLERHLAKAHKGGKACKRFVYRSSELDVSKKSQGQCHICKKIFKYPHYVATHVLQVHEGKFPFHCEVCGVGVASKTALTAHAVIHDSPPFKCYVKDCKSDQMFDSIKELRKHVRVEHPMPKNKQCSQCGRRFSNCQRLRNHEAAMHSQDRETKPHKCIICQKGFGTNQYLLYHVYHTHKLNMSQFKALNDEKIE